MTAQAPHHNGRQPATCARRAFSLIDLLVSLTVVAVLIGILLPSLSIVRETTRRVVCSSNVRQHGYGLALFTDDNRDLLPPSRQGLIGAQRTLTVRGANDGPEWDGLGILFESGYLSAPGVYYCPSHTGDHPYLRYAAVWNEPAGEVVTNYQYRGHGVDNIRHLGVLQARRPTTALVTDGLRTIYDFNHRIGCNILRADLAVAWFSDLDGALRRSLPESENDAMASQRVEDAWNELDSPTLPPT